jgi:hypothetical protein
VLLVASEHLGQRPVSPACEIERDIAIPAEMRALLGLKGADKISFPKPEAA